MGFEVTKIDVTQAVQVQMGNLILGKKQVWFDNYTGLDNDGEEL